MSKFIFDDDIPDLARGDLAGQGVERVEMVVEDLSHIAMRIHKSSGEEPAAARDERRRIMGLITLRQTMWDTQAKRNAMTIARVDECRQILNEIMGIPEEML